MSWFRKALTITTIHPDSFYTSMDPGEFYEWKFTGVIPKGKIFTKKLPPSDVFASGKIIATTRLPSSDLDKRDFGFETNKDIYTDIYLQAGQIQSASELINRYYRIKEKFNQSIQDFKSGSFVRSYFIADDHLYKVSNQTGDLAHLYNYGLIKDILQKLNETRNIMNKNSMNKSGRAYEMEDFRRFENAMTFVQNSTLPVDSSKIDLLLSLSEISPENDVSMTWEDCYTTVSNDAKSTKDLLDRYNSLSWVQASLSLSSLI